MIEEFLFQIIVVFYRLIHYFFMYQFIYEVVMKYLSIYSLYKLNHTKKHNWYRVPSISVTLFDLSTT